MPISMVATSIRRRGFTIIELSVIILVLVLVAAIVFPRLQAIERGREYREFRLGLRRIAVDAREKAVSLNQTVGLAVDESGGQLLATVGDGAGEDVVVARLRMPSDVSVSTVSVAGSNAATAEWRLPIYADGRSEGGGIEFEVGDQALYLMVREDGSVEFGDGALPDTGTEKWQAGELEQRQ